MKTFVQIQLKRIILKSVRVLQQALHRHPRLKRLVHRLMVLMPALKQLAFWGLTARSTAKPSNTTLGRRGQQIYQRMRWLSQSRRNH